MKSCVGTQVFGNGISQAGLCGSSNACKYIFASGCVCTVLTRRSKKVLLADMHMVFPVGQSGCAVFCCNGSPSPFAVFCLREEVTICP